MFGIGATVALAGLIASPPAASAQCSAASYGADIYGVNKDVGGGLGYTDLVSPSSAHYLVDTRAELMMALVSARSGQIIYVEDTASIDLSADTEIVIPAGVTLASGRGRNNLAGGRLYTRSDVFGLFLVVGNNVRITGLRIEGPQSTMDRNGAVASGIMVRDAQSFEIDNCELYYWPQAAVTAQNTHVDAHHNHFHHNRQGGAGYGVVLVHEASAVVQSNIFDHNRHDIASNGDPRQTYTAVYNLVIGQGNGHSFDVHGEQERWLCPSRYAGGLITIERNTWVDEAVIGVKLRGAPHEHAYIRNNRLSGTKSYAITQSWPTKRRPDFDGQVEDGWDDDEFKCEQNPYIFGEYTRVGGGYERMTTDPNCYEYVGWYRFDTKYGGFYPLAQSGFALDALRFGDFNNDKKADVFRLEGNEWKVSYGGTSDWTTIGSSSYPMSVLAFGNFVGDSRTDVFRAAGGAWYASDGGANGWQKLSTKSDQVSSLAFADFNNDGKTDVFRTSNGQWEVSYSGTSAWTVIGSSSYTLSSLRLGDFNGDGKADVFRRASGGWYVSYGGTMEWTRLNTLNHSLSSIAFGNFVGSKATDVLWIDGLTWYVSDGGQSAPQVYAELLHGEYSIADFAFADFTADGKTDVFFAGTP